MIHFDVSNRAWFPQHRKYLGEHRPPSLIVWVPQDDYMPEQPARACLRDLPEAELHLLAGGHWLLETHPTRWWRLSVISSGVSECILHSPPAVLKALHALRARSRHLRANRQRDWMRLR